MAEQRDEFLSSQFPTGFKFGLASSAYQVEGAWNLDGKGESVWDAFCHDKDRPNNIVDGSSGDVACDSYHKYKEDVQLLKNMGAKVYRFSIAWTRILPNGTLSKINQAGINHYNQLINELLANEIEPFITLYHWDLPAAFQSDWLDENMIDHFGAFARICFAAFGDRVKRWITINEPFADAIAGFGYGFFPPANRSEPGLNPYIVAQNLLKAHAVAYHIYQEEFKAEQKGQVGITLDSWWYEPLDPTSKSDVLASQRSLQFRLGWFAHPIFKGDYPPVMRELMDRKSIEEGRTESRLPSLSKEWVTKIKGTSDFLGINHYTTELTTDSAKKSNDKDASEGGTDGLAQYLADSAAKSGEQKTDNIGWQFDHNCDHSFDPSWPKSGCVWLRHAPWGLRKLLNWVKTEYENPEVIITENGVSTPDARLEDTDRVTYFKTYINEVLKAIVVDGCKVTGYMAWAFLDCFEWNTGYTVHFGVHAVDRDSPEKTRTPRASAKLLTTIFKNHGFPEEE